MTIHFILNKRKMSKEKWAIRIKIFWASKIVEFVKKQNLPQSTQRGGAATKNLNHRGHRDHGEIINKKRKKA